MHEERKKMKLPQQTSVMPVSPADRPRLRLGYLDGLRGLAALYVVVFHISQLCQVYVAGDRPMPNLLRRVLAHVHFLFLGYGRYAVDVFIVLSGYCLMLPLARAGTDTLTDGFGSFIKRRSWRILPPYYAALLLSILVMLFVPGMGARNGSYWDTAVPDADHLSSGVVLSHVLLVHSWSNDALRIDPPMWSVAVEWQIYFLFPLLVLPLRKWFGSAATVLLCFVAGVMVTSYVNRHVEAPHLYGWFLGLFAMGVFAAAVGFDHRRSDARWRRAPWKPLSIVFTLVVFGLTMAQRKSWEHVSWLRWARYSTWGSEWPMDLFIGLATMCLVLHLTDQVPALAERGEKAKRGWMLATLESAWATRLGEFSYSLYLVHAPVLSLVDLACRRAAWSPARTCVMEFAVALPLAVGIGFAFHLMFERPFMRLRSGAKAEAKVAVRGAPADMNPANALSTAPAPAVLAG
jgi:peptidoglycan/LPS O-acetylase OafA/YrhL